jgi:hypothetical protein
MTDDTTDETTDDATTEEAPTDDATTDEAPTDEEASTTNSWGDSRSRDTASRDGRDESRNASEPRRSSQDSGGWSGTSLRALQWFGLVVLMFVAIATLFAFYSNVSELISIWATRKYEPLLQAAFALIVLAASLAGITRLFENLD